MARRKSDLADKLSGSTPVPGWRDLVNSGQDPSPPPRQESTADQMKRKTYLLTNGIIERVAALSEQERVGVNELARYLLQFALEEIETGRHTLPTESEQRKRIIS